MQNRQQAKRELEYAKRRALINGVLATLRGEENHLMPFEWVRHLRPRGEHYRGTTPIPLEQVVGSVDRYRDFDLHFLPREEYLDDRWMSIRMAQLDGRELPPIQVYKVGDVYFVKDGNHRVSVARRLGQKYIDAEVIELEVKLPPEPGDTLRDLIIKGEYADFLQKTRLQELRPGHQEILFTAPGRYDVLLEHIQTRQYFLGLKFGREVSWEEAVTSWYDKIYTHVTEQLRSQDVLSRFPGRTEADLYLWIMDHRYFLSQKYGFDVGSARATADFSRNFAPHWYERWGRQIWNRWRQRDPLSSG